MAATPPLLYTRSAASFLVMHLRYPVRAVFLPASSELRTMPWWCSYVLTEKKIIKFKLNRLGGFYREQLALEPVLDSAFTLSHTFSRRLWFELVTFVWRLYNFTGLVRPPLPL